MSELAIRVESGYLQGCVVPPPSKSDAHRALICAYLAGSPASVSGISGQVSDDITTTINCLNSLLGGKKIINCRESGTTLRLLLPLAAVLGRQVEFTGEGRLPQRPLREYSDIFAGHGARLEFTTGLSLPLNIFGALRPGKFYAPGNVSSQYISGLLLSLPLLDGDSEVILTSPLQSAPYVDMTLNTMRKFGVSCLHDQNIFTVPGGQSYVPCVYEVEADYSQSAFWLTAAFSGSRLEIKGLSNTSVQGDRAIVNLLAEFKMQKDEYEIDVSQIPDLVPILSVAAALVPAKTRLTNASRLRLKESDRLKSTRTSLNLIGADIREDTDGLTIYGGRKLRGGKADSFGDHRIAMALAIAALSTTDGVIITGAQSVSKSYPDFFDQMRYLGGVCNEFNLD